MKFLDISPKKSINKVKFYFTIKPIDINKKNIPAFLSKMGIKYKTLTVPSQTHRDCIGIVSDLGKNSSFHNTDALITTDRYSALCILVADCIAVYIYDIKNHIIGLIHSGWRGTLLNITKKTLVTMQREFNTNPSDCFIVFSPSIRQCCYEISKKLASRFKMVFPFADEFINNEDCPRLSLQGINKRILENIGVKKENIEISRYCTSCNESLFFSYRRDKKILGRHLAVAMLL